MLVLGILVRQAIDARKSVRGFNWCKETFCAPSRPSRQTDTDCDRHRQIQTELTHKTDAQTDRRTDTESKR